MFKFEIFLRWFASLMVQSQQFTYFLIYLFSFGNFFLFFLISMNLFIPVFTFTLVFLLHHATKGDFIQSQSQHSKIRT